MAELKTFALPAGTPLSTKRGGARLSGDAVVVCLPEDEWLIRDALDVPGAGDAMLFSGQRLKPPSSISAAASPISDRATHQPATPDVDCSELLGLLEAEIKASGERLIRELEQSFGGVPGCHCSGLSDPASHRASSLSFPSEPSDPGDRRSEEKRQER